MVRQTSASNREFPRTVAAWAIVGGLLVTSCGGSTQPASPSAAITIRWGINDPYFNGNIPVTVGIQSGIFKKHGLNVDTVQAQSPMPPLIAGDTDLAVSGAPPWLSAVSQGKDSIVVAALFPKATQAVMVLPSSPLVQYKNKWPDAIQHLRGKSIGVSVVGAQVDLSTRYMLIKAGLTPDKDVTIRALGGGTPQAAGLISGHVDAIMGFVPGIQSLESSGKAVSILDFTQLPSGAPSDLDQPYMLAVASPKFLKDHAHVVPTLRAALQETDDYIMNGANTAALTKMLSPYFAGISQSDLAAVIRQMRQGGLHAAYGCADFAKAVDLMTTLGKLSVSLGCAKYVKGT